MTCTNFCGDNRPTAVREKASRAMTWTKFCLDSRPTEYESQTIEDVQSHMAIPYSQYIIAVFYFPLSINQHKKFKSSETKQILQISKLCSVHICTHRHTYTNACMHTHRKVWAQHICTWMHECTLSFSLAPTHNTNPDIHTLFEFRDKQVVLNY